jgi:hypothetical protein
LIAVALGSLLFLNASYIIFAALGTAIEAKPTICKGK